MKKRTIRLFCIGIAGTFATFLYTQTASKSETDLLISNIEALAKDENPDPPKIKYDWGTLKIDCTVYVANKEDPTKEGTYIPGKAQPCFSGTAHDGCPDCQI